MVITYAGARPRWSTQRRGPPRNFHSRGLIVTAIGPRPDGYTSSMVRKQPERVAFPQIPQGMGNQLTQIEIFVPIVQIFWQPRAEDYRADIFSPMVANTTR